MTIRQECKILCALCGYNPAVGEFDIGNGRGVNFYCRKCVEENIEDFTDESEYELDESLVFCSREWDKQA